MMIAPLQRSVAALGLVVIAAIAGLRTGGSRRTEVARMGRLLDRVRARRVRDRDTDRERHVRVHHALGRRRRCSGRLDDRRREGRVDAAHRRQRRRAAAGGEGVHGSAARLVVGGRAAHLPAVDIDLRRTQVRRRPAILSMTSTGEWLDVRGVSSYGAETCASRGIATRGSPHRVPAEIASAVRERGAGTDAARINAGAADRSEHGHRGVARRGQHGRGRVAVRARAAFRARREHPAPARGCRVPGTVTDAMVAVSNPGAFRLARVPEQSDVIDTDTPDQSASHGGEGDAVRSVDVGLVRSRRVPIRHIRTATDTDTADTAADMATATTTGTTVDMRRRSSS